MRKSVWSLPFDASTEFVTRQELLTGDTSLSPGDAVPESVFSPRRLRQLFDMRTIVHRVTYEALVNGVSHFESDPFEPAEEPAADATNDEGQAPAADATNGDGQAPAADAGEQPPVIITEPVVLQPLGTGPTVPVIPVVVTGLPGLPIVEQAAPVPADAPEQEETEDAAKTRLIAEAKSLGIDPDGRWGVKRLQAEIDKVNNGKSA